MTWSSRARSFGARFSRFWRPGDAAARESRADHQLHVEARGRPARVCLRQDEVAGTHIEYGDETGFTAGGNFVDVNAPHHGGLVLRRRAASCTPNR
ncbi:Atu4866 domain-containing protein [Teichococcus vastitatis]|uniref:Atu4866 domain-containing protein n=1 Tax=Teichococcus vastitatis TaxID=2307076 RepID=UPI000E7117DC